MTLCTSNKCNEYNQEKLEKELLRDANFEEFERQRKIADLNYLQSKIKMFEIVHSQWESQHSSELISSFVGRFTTYNLMPHFTSYISDPYMKPTRERKKMHEIPFNNITTKTHRILNNYKYQFSFNFVSIFTNAI